VNSLVFAEYLNRVLWDATRGDDAPSEVIPQWVLNATAVTVVILVVVLVAGARGLGPRAAVVLTSMKVCNPRINFAISFNETRRIPVLPNVKVLAVVCLDFFWPLLLFFLLLRFVFSSFALSRSASSIRFMVVVICAFIRNRTAPSNHRRLRLLRMRARYTPVFGPSMGSTNSITSPQKCSTQSATYHVRSTSRWVSWQSVVLPFDPTHVLIDGCEYLIAGFVLICERGILLCSGYGNVALFRKKICVHGFDALLLSQAVIAQSNTIALDFGWALFGRAGGVVFALVVAFSCLGALTGAAFTNV
jgi:hypothetical protein